MPETRVCNIGYCTRPVRRDGLCSPHYANKLHHGHPQRGPQPKNPVPGEGFLARIFRRPKTDA